MPLPAPGAAPSQAPSRGAPSAAPEGLPALPPLPPPPPLTPPPHDGDSVSPDPAGSAEVAAPADPDDPTTSSLAAYMRKRRFERQALVPPVLPYPTETASAPAPPRAIDTFRLVAVHTFIWPYLASALVGGVAVECDPACGRDSLHLGWLLVPGLGPFISAAFLGNHINEGARGVLFADGIVQSVGLAALIGSVVFEPHNSTGGPRSSALSVRIAPWAASGTGPTGLAISGSF